MTLEEQARRERFRMTRPKVYAKMQQINEQYAKGQSIATIRLEYNYACNMQCKHCSISGFQHKQDRQKLTIEDVRRVYTQADEMGLCRTVITGGEPLVFSDLEEVVKAIDPQRFYISMDTNAWLLDADKAKWLKSIGIDRVQISIDSMNPMEHDDFRQKVGSHTHTLKGLVAAQQAGLDVNITTVVTKERLYSAELLEFLAFFTKEKVPVCCQWAKPVGKYEGRTDILINKEDIMFEKELEKKYMVFNHLTPAYGLDIGCLVVKGIFTITAYGDILPCPYIHISLGNIFEEPLQHIIKRGMTYFGKHVNTCLIAEDKDFIKLYQDKVYGKQPPVPYTEVFLDTEANPELMYGAKNESN